MNNPSNEFEDVLIALDQVSQTVEVISSVVDKLKAQIMDMAYEDELSTESFLSGYDDPDAPMH